MHFTLSNALLASVAALAAIQGLAVAADGPGLGNFTYTSAELERRIATFSSPLNHGHVGMVKGYLLAAQGAGAGGSISLYDVSNPRSPTRVAYVNRPEMGEAHSFTQVGTRVVFSTRQGIQIWNFAQPLAPVLDGSLAAPTGAASDNWLCWQWPYVYQGLGGSGMNIIDARNPASPVLVKRLPTSATGGFAVGPVEAIGNMLVITWKRNDGDGVSTLDITDPENPTLLDSLRDGAPIYSSCVNGNRVFAFGNDGAFYAWDISNPRDIRRITKISGVGGKGGYGMFQDGKVFGGFSTHTVIVNTNTSPWTHRSIASSTYDPGIHNADWDFGSVLGNLYFSGNDDGGGSVWIPHQTAPDTTPPRVTQVDPVDGATGISVRSRIGVTLSDRADDRSVNTSRFMVRPVGGSAIAGTISLSHQAVMNFTPAAPLQASTTYEVVLSAGGIRDQAGNAVATQFLSRFTTVGAAPPPPANTPPTVAITAPANAATFTAPASISISAAAADSDGTVSRVEFFNGGTKLGEDTTSPYSFTWSNVAAGSYTLTAHATDNSGATTTSGAVSVSVGSGGGNVASPTAAITTPAAAAQVPRGSVLTYQGTAADTDGGSLTVRWYIDRRGDGMQRVLLSDSSQPVGTVGGTLTMTGTLTSTAGEAVNMAAEGSDYTFYLEVTDGVHAVATAERTFRLVAPTANVAPTVAITAPANAATFTAPASITISATAADSDGTVSRVEFFHGGTKLGEDSTSPYSFAWTNVAAGSYTLTARATDNSGATTTSSAVSVSVNATTPPPSSGVFREDAGMVVMEAEHFSRQAAHSDTLAWSVATALAGFSAEGYVQTPDSGTANTAWAGAAGLEYDVAIGTAGTYTIWLRRQFPNTAANSAYVGANGVQTGSEFDNGSGTGWVWVKHTSTMTLAAGTRVIELRRREDGYQVDRLLLTTNAAYVPTGAGPAESLRGGSANAAPTVAITAPANAATFTAPANITISATAADSDGTVSRVEFFNGATRLGEDSTSPYSFTWSNVAAGSYTLTARATDHNGAATTSGAVNISVQAASPLAVTLPPGAPSLVGATATLGAGVQATNAVGTVRYVWSFGDGTPDSASSTSPGTSHVWSVAGHYLVVLRATDDRGTVTASYVHTVHHPLTATAPTTASTIVLHRTRQTMWAVNSDANTVARMDAVSLAKLGEDAVGADPRTLAVAGDGSVWVACRRADQIAVLDGASGATLATIALPPGSAPHGVVFSPDHQHAFVTCEGTGLLHRFNPTTRASTGSLALGPTPRGIAVAADSRRVLVTRFISPEQHGQVWDVDGSTLTLTRTIALGLDAGEGGSAPDSEFNARGLPNYLAAITISPDGRRAWVPAKKDNIQRGTGRDGRPLTFDSTVRAMVACIDLITHQDLPAERIDINDADAPVAVALTPRGDHLLVALQGSNTVRYFDAYTGQPNDTVGLGPDGLAPRGLAFNADGSRLFVQNFMSRSVGVWNTAGFLDSSDLGRIRVGSVASAATEPLAANVLHGKQIFYNAADARMSLQSYISCASCHVDGGHDGRTWDFTDRGEGLRNTTDLRGRRGTGHGRVHWSANFDEIQDFENDIRLAFGGRGFLSDADFAATSGPLATPKAGRSSELDALAAYVTSLNAVELSPARGQAGSLSPDAAAGRLIVQRLDCARCHGGSDFTDSSTGALHDVGSITAASGTRLGQPLTGIDTPTLKGLWNGAPYFHDGSAATLEAVIDRGDARHGGMASLSAVEKAQLAAFLRQLDEREPAVPRAGTLPAQWSLGDVGAVAAAGSATVANGVWTVKGAGADIWGRVDEFHFVHQGLDGDGEITARIVSVQNTNSWAKAGVMIREGLAANAVHAFVGLTPVNGVAFQRRTATGGSSSHTAGAPVPAPYWVRLSRVGNDITASESADGITWRVVGTTTLPLGAQPRIGLAVTSHNDGTLCTAVFDNVSIATAPSGFN